MTGEQVDRGRHGDAAPPGFAVLYPDEPFELHAGPATGSSVAAR